jgi:hypothetical protein
LEANILQFFNDLLQPVDIDFSNIKPSHKKDYLIEPPSFFITWIYDKLVDPLSLKTASTAKSAKCCLSWVNNFELNVVFAMLIKSFLNFYASYELSLAI